MFASLDRVDITLKPDEHGCTLYIQTDHRTAEDVEGEPELSVLLALVRVLNPKRMATADVPEPVVMYFPSHMPPTFLRHAIQSAGGLIVLDESLQPEPNEHDVPPLDDLLQSAFSDMGRAVAKEYDVSMTAEGIGVVERNLAEHAGTAEDDETQYWSSVIKLGAFAGEVIRNSCGGRWRMAESGSLPFALATTFNNEPATVNTLGKAIKRFTNGEEDSLVTLAELLLHKP